MQSNAPEKERYGLYLRSSVPPVVEGFSAFVSFVSFVVKEF
jgi:hypothetical protein